MAIVSDETRDVTFKIVYCGAPLAGKSTNLQWVHSQLPDAECSDLVSLSNSADQILFFDFHPRNGTEVHGYKSRFQLYTVPGPVHYNATRQLVLRDVDGIVFVADSQADRLDENVAARNQMLGALLDNGIAPDRIPLVVQYNKRDVNDVLPVEQLDAALSAEAKPCVRFEASASRGVSVFDTLNAAAIEVLNRFKPPTFQKRRSIRGKAALTS